MAVEQPAVEDPPAKPTRPCPNCGGSGEVAVQAAAGWHVADCPACQGVGRVPYLGSKKA